MPKFGNGDGNWSKTKDLLYNFRDILAEIYYKFSKFPTIKINKENYFKKEPSEN